MADKKIGQAEVKLRKDKGCWLCKKLFDCPGKDPGVTLCLQFEKREVAYEQSTIDGAAEENP